jgi:hypothetical protein
MTEAPSSCASNETLEFRPRGYDDDGNLVST